MTVSAIDRIAELVLRHHLGQYASTSVGTRLDTLFAQPIEDLPVTTTALISACDYLGITGEHLDLIGQEADRRNQRCADNTSNHAKAAK